MIAAIMHACVGPCGLRLRHPLVPRPALARAELQIAMSAVFRWLPNLRITVPLDEIAFKQDTTVYRVRELPVTW